MEKSILFENWRQWKVCFQSGCSKAAWGVVRIITCLLLAVPSVGRGLLRGIVRFISKEPKIAIGVAVFMVVAAWFITFATMRARVVSAEYQRDSISYEYQLFRKGVGYE